MSKEVTVDLSGIVSPEQVAQYLEMLATMIRMGSYQKILDNHTFFSTEGDGYGMENTCINFKSVYGYDGRSDEIRDFGEVIDSLVQRNQIKKEAIAKLKGQIEKVEAM